MMRATLHPSARRDMRKGAPVARAPTRRKEHGGAHLSSTDTPKTFRKKNVKHLIRDYRSRADAARAA